MNKKRDFHYDKQWDEPLPPVTENEEYLKPNHDVLFVGFILMIASLFIGIALGSLIFGH